ncbi:MAG: polyprenol monophosphomannose synthase [Fibrobacter sp.]|nr:polyprenol monophosphomannose synthase [Fibrobacter sp.]
MKPGEILIIIPTFNERENIVLLIPEVKKILPEADILVVDDSSPDGTGQCVKEIAATINGVNLLERSKKEGLGKAYISGFKWALERNYQYIFEMDADFSHDPKFLPDFISAIQENDLVIGSRYKSGVNVVNWPMKRLLLSYYANQLARVVTGIPIRDSTGGFKCFRRSVLEALKLEKISSSGYFFQLEINFFAWKRGFRIKEIPIIFPDRKRGVSKMSTKIIREALFLLLRLRFISFFKRNY